MNEEDKLPTAIIVFCIIVWVASAAMCSSLASEKGYGTGWAAFLDFVFGLFALIYYAGLPLSEEKRRAEYSVVASAVSAAMARTAAQPSAPAQAAPDRSTPAVQPFAGPPEARSARTIDALKALDAETSSSRKLPVAGKADAIVCSACGQEQPSFRRVCYKCGARFETGEVPE